MTSNGSKAMTARPGRTAAVILAAVAMLSAACAAQPETVPRLGVPLLAQPQPPGVATTPEGAKSPTECPAEAPHANTPFDPRKSSYRPLDPMPTPYAMPKGSTMDRIVQRGYLIAGVNQNLNRFGSIDPHNGTWEGFDVDIVQEIALALFGDRTRMRFRAVNFSNQFEVLGNKKVDILANSITITCERRYDKDVLFTTNYFDSGQRVMVPKRSNYQNIEDLRGRKVCAPNRTTSMGKILETRTLVPFPVAEFTDCLALLQQGQIDAISTTDSVLLGLIDQDPTMHMVGSRLTDEPHGLAVRASEKDFVRFVNGVLQRVRDDGTWRQLYLKWLVGLDTEVPPPPEAKYLD